MNGKCPECGEVKEITDSGALRGYCDDCHKMKYTCDGCGNLLEDAWLLFVDTEKGKGHRECIESM